MANKELKPIKKSPVLLRHLSNMSPADFKKKYGENKTTVRTMLGLDRNNKPAKDPGYKVNTYTLGGWKSLGRQNRVGQARDGVNESAGRSVNRNLSNPKK